MQVKLTFLGAAQNVTGSRFLVEVDALKVLIDCGLYQERHLIDRNWAPFPTPPAEIDAVCLTHAHLDHCGLLPKFVREGFAGKIHCTSATAELAQLVLADSARLQEEDAQFKAKRHAREGRKAKFPEAPLYTCQDAERCSRHFQGVPYGQPVALGDGVTATFCNAGHVFGSAMIKLDINRNGEHRSMLFTGDMGRPNMPILDDPDVIDHADYLVMESTYGDQEHDPHEQVRERLAEVINQTHEAGGNVVIPSFAIERSQDLLYHINELLLANKIPHLLTFLDSPMAIAATEVFRKHPELYDAKMADRVDNHRSPFDLPGLTMSRTTEQSKAINHVRGTAIIIAGSGMCNGGRIKHHLVSNITRPESTILFVGYQAVGTLGRQIFDGAKQVRILGQKYMVKARVEKIRGFSAHADRLEMLNWLNSMKSRPQRIFLVHGEPEGAASFREYLIEKTGMNVTVPTFQESVSLS